MNLSAFETRSPEPGRVLWIRDLVVAAVVFLAVWAIAHHFHPFEQLRQAAGAAWLDGFFMAGATAALVTLGMALRNGIRLEAEVRRRGQAEARTQAAAEQARQLLDATGEGIYALDRGGRCLWANPAAARIFGYSSPEPLIGRVMHDLIHHTREDGTPFPAEECRGMANLRAGLGVTQPNELLWRADGTSFRAEVRVNPIVQNGEVTGAVVALSDVTERLRLEEQFRQAQKMESVGRLAAGVAHDFNNLLTVINGYAAFLTADLGDAPGLRHRAAAIAEAGRRAATLTGQLLAFSRQQVLNPELLDLNRVVANLEPMLRQIVREDIELQISPAAALPSIHADAVQIEMAIMNLVANARDAVAAAGRIEVRTGAARVPLDAAPANLAAGDYVTLAVEDNGAGMDEATRSRIFEPFFTTKPAGEGTGLGLAAIFGLARQSGGAITVASAPGRGTCMTLFLPADTGARGGQSPAAASAAAVRPSRPTATGAATGAAAVAAPALTTVLVAEDDPAVRNFAVEVLRAHGYSALAATSSVEAEQLAESASGAIQLLLTDIVMPGLSGRDLARRLRARRPDLAVIYMSGYPGRDAGADLRDHAHFLAKPFTPAALAAAVEAALAPGGH